MKKIISVLLAAAAVVSMSVSADADVIDVPFIDDVGEITENIEQRYYTLTEDCTAYENIKDKEIADTLKKGDIVCIDTKFTDESGTQWGGALTDNTDLGYMWLDMNKVEVIYDRFSFAQEHIDEFFTYEGELDDYKPVENIAVWEYPGSDIVYLYPAENWFTDPNYFLTLHENVDYSWRDENGGLWAFFGYGIYGWVYVESPEATTVNSVIGKVSDFTDYSERIDYLKNMSLSANTENSKTKSAYTLPIILSVAAAVLSAAMIFALKKKE